MSTSFEISPPQGHLPAFAPQLLTCLSPSPTAEARAAGSGGLVTAPLPLECGGHFLARTFLGLRSVCLGFQVVSVPQAPEKCCFLHGAQHPANRNLITCDLDLILGIYFLSISQFRSQGLKPLVSWMRYWGAEVNKTGFSCWGSPLWLFSKDRGWEDRGWEDRG